MSAGVITGTGVTRELPEDDAILELTGGENPLGFLTMNAETILGLIAWMDDYDRIEGWRRAETEFIDSDRSEVLEALERQRLCLERGDNLPIYHKPVHQKYDPATDPLEDEIGEDDVDDADEPVTEPTAHEKHEDAKGLDIGQVLIVDRDTSTEYVWPQRAGEDEPYILQAYTAEDELRDEMTLSADEIYSRLEFDPDRCPADEIHIRPPTSAAVNRGDSQ